MKALDVIRFGRRRSRQASSRACRAYLLAPDVEQRRELHELAIHAPMESSSSSSSRS
jgi:hypothetical protein